MKMVQRALVLMLSVLMVLSAFPAATFAEDEAITEDAVNTVEAQEPVKETAPETQPAEVVEPVQEEVKTDAEAVVNEETAPADGESVAEEEEEKYPAQTLKVTASDGAVITVEASEGAFPEDSYVKAKPVSEEAVLALIDGAVEAAAYDITVYDADGNEVQPKKAVEVSFANTGLSDADAVYYVNDAMTKATLVTDSIDDPSDSFTTDHFSFYVVTGLSQESDGWKGYVGSLIEHKSSRSITVGETISLTCNLQSVTSSRPDQSTFNQWNNGWHVVKATSDSPDVSEAISYSTDIFYDRSGAKWKPFITINALKPGTYSVEQWEERHDGEGLMMTLIIKEKFTVTFNANGHGTAPAEQKVIDGEKATKPDDPSEDGYIFGGWYENSGCTGDPFDFSTPITGNKTLYAKWVKSYKVKFVDEDGTTIKGPDEYEEGTEADAVEKPDDPTKTEETDEYVYRFAGWEPPVGNVTGDATYKATYTKVPKYRIHYEKNYFFGDGTIDIPSDQFVVSGEPAAVANNPAGGNPYFIAWNTAADGSGTRYNLHGYNGGQRTITLSDNITLYAEWKYSIYFEGNGGTLKDIPNRIEFTNPAEQKIPSGSAEREGYEYLGWATSSNATSAKYVAGDDFDPERFSTTLYAVWKINEYQIKYDLGGGSLEEGKTNPTSYTEADTFTLNNPVKEGYKFLGWTGTGLTEASKEVTVAKRSTGNREYTANWEELDTYSLDVALIHAGVEASTADVEEADDKISIGTTSWVATQSDVDALKAYFAGQSGSGPAPFSDYFRAGETYYSVAIVTFADDEEADARRVKLNTTEFVKSAGDPVVNESENEVIVPFAVTIPAITVTVEFGSNHADLAAQAAASSPEGVTMTANGGTLTYKAEKGSDRWYDVTNPLRNVLADLDTSNPDNGELMYRGFVQYNLHPLDYYASAEACAAEMETAMENVQQNEDLKLYILWTKPADVELTITKPLCGTEVTFDESAREQSPRPAITVTGGNAQIYKYEDDDFSYDPNLWITGGDGGSVDPFSGEIVGGSTYRAMTMLMPDFGYYIEPENITINGGTPVSSDTGYRPDAPIYIDVEAEHDWSDWEIKKAPTATEEGLKEHTCKHCNEKMTEVIPAKGYGPGEDPNQKGKDGTSTGRGASEACADKAITSSTSEEGPKGTQFAPLALRSTKQGNTTITLTWTKPSGATKYVVYGVSCGKGKKLKKITTTTKTSYTVKKIGSSKLKKGTTYRFIVVALSKNSNVVSTSKAVHVATKGGKITNYKSVTTKARKNRVSVKKGKTFKLGAKAVKQSVKLTVKDHRGLRYVSTNTKVATVSTKGTIKGKKKGSCYVYVYAQNGVFKKIKVTVK